MGLDLSHGDYCRSYSAFSFMRNYMAQRAGIPGEIQEQDFYKFWVASIDWDYIPHSALMGKWKDVTPQDYLHIILAHSDCEGKIQKKHLIPLAERMEEILNMPEPENPQRCYANDAYSYNESVARSFIASLKAAHEDGKSLKFY